MYILSISEHVLLFISGFGTLQGILLAFLLYFHPKADRSVNIFLALYILCFSAVTTMPLILRVFTWQKGIFLEPLPLLVGPVLYFYLRSFKEVITWRKALPHFLPFFLFFFLAYPVLIPLVRQFRNAKEVPAEVLRHPASIALNMLKLSLFLLYYFLARKTLAHYQRSIRHLFSDTESIDLNWARLLINGYLLIVCATIVLITLMILYPPQFNLFFLINITIATPYIYLATYKGVTQPTIWQVKPGINKEEVEEEMVEAEAMETHKISPGKPGSLKGGLNTDRINDLVKRITGLMEEEKLYEDPELTLQELANKLQLPPYQISQAINEGMKKNFYDLINSYRVEEAKRLLIDPKNINYTILSVGFEAGFNSKTTFNTVFKKFTGLTPTDFREKEKMSLEQVETAL